MIYRLYYVRCDGCGKPCGKPNEVAATSAGARKVARDKGWHRTPRRSYAAGGSPGADLCPTCAAPPAIPEGAAARYNEAREQGRDQVESLARALIPGIPS